MGVARAIGLVLLLAGLSACGTPPLPLADVAVIKAADGSTDGMDIYAVRRAAGEQVPALRGNQIVEVRTYLPKTNDFGQEVPGQEIAGALCDVILDNHRAQVRTPGGVHVPLYGYQTAAFSVECQLDGFKKAIVVAQPFNQTIAQRRAAAGAAAGSAGLLGALVAVVVVEGINAASDETNDEFRYALPPVLMRQGTGTVQATAAAPAAATPRPTPQATAAATTPQSVASPASTAAPAVRSDNLAEARQNASTDCAPWCDQAEGRGTQTPNRAAAPAAAKPVDNAAEARQTEAIQCAPWCNH